MNTWPLDSSLPAWPSASIRCWFPEPSLASSLEPATDDGAEAWEAACVREVQQGRPESFNPLVAHYAPRIRAYLHRMVRNREEAEDLTQETFLKAFQAIPRFQPDRPFKRWIYTIATNTGLNALRTRKRKGMQVEFDAYHVSAGSVHAGAAMAARESDMVENLEAALSTLPPRALQLVTLHYHEGFSLQEAGAVLGISEGAAKVALCRARQHLRSVLIEGQQHRL